MKDAPALFFYEQSDAFEALVQGDESIFESRPRLLVFAASVGFRRNHWVEDHDTNGESRWNYIAQNPRLSLIVSSITYAHTQDPMSILDPEAQINVLTSYGAGGTRILEREVVEKPGTNLENMISFLNENRDQEEITAQVGILEEIEQEISSLRSD